MSRRGLQHFPAPVRPALLRPARVRPALLRPAPLAAIAATVGVGVGVGVDSPLVASAGSLLTVVIVLELERRRRVRWRRELADVRVRAIDGLAQQLRAGAALSEACRALPRGAGLDPLVAGLAEGQPLEAAVRSLSPTPRDSADAPPPERDQDRVAIAVTLGALATDGGRALPAIERLRGALHAGIDRRQRIEAQAAQALNSAALLALAPLGFGLLVAMVDPAVAGVYRRDLLGAVCGTAAVALAALGWWWIQRLILGSSGRPTRRSDPPEAALLPTLDLVAVVVGAGGTVHEAVAVVGDHGPAAARRIFRAITAEVAGGALLRDAIAAVGHRLEHPTFVPLLDALWVAQARGAPLGQLLEQLTVDADQRERAAAQAATGRLSVALLPPLVVCFLPAMVVGSIVPLAVTALRSLRTA